MVKGKSTAKEGGRVNLVVGRDTDLETVTGSSAPQLQLHRVNEVFQTLWHPAQISEKEAQKLVNSVIAMMEGIKPEGEVEGMLAAQMVATHSAAMECLKRAMFDGQSFAGRDLNLKHAAKFLSIYTRQVEVLDKHRGKGQQKVTVEYVNVEPGGQAIVGHVEMGRRKRRKGPVSPETPAIDHAPEVPLEIPDPVVSQKAPRKTRRER